MRGGELPYRSAMADNRRMKYLVPFAVTMLAIVVIMTVVVIVLFNLVDTPL